MTKKPDLDDATIQIARRMLSTPPKPHNAMKIRTRKGKQRYIKSSRRQKGTIIAGK
jgi:hypothetical protein